MPLLCVSSCLQTGQDTNIDTGFKRRRRMFTRTRHLRCFFLLLLRCRGDSSVPSPPRQPTRKKDKMWGKEKGDSKHYAHFSVSLEITTHQPLLQAVQVPAGCSGPAQRLSLPPIGILLAPCIIYNSFFFKYSVFLKQRCYFLQNITLFIQNKRGLVSHPAKWQPCCCWVALDSTELQVTTPFSTQ